MKIKETVTVQNTSGLHLRSAATFVHLCSQYKSRVSVYRGRRLADARSILSLVSLGVHRGSELVILIEGEDAEEARKDIREFFLKNPNMRPS
jgi:phosphocarrier protein HPr